MVNTNPTKLLISKRIVTITYELSYYIIREYICGSDSLSPQKVMFFTLSITCTVHKKVGKYHNDYFVQNSISISHKSYFFRVL